MRISALAAPVALFLLQIPALALADPVIRNDLSSETSLVPREPTITKAAAAEIDARDTPKAAPKGTLDAPVDGKDGKPHAGPWVETNADRDRKKAASASTEGSTEIKPKGSKSELPSANGEHQPHDYSGVMDDPHRTGPKEGTRGTEGGVSGKSKDAKTAGDKVTGTPKAPKEAPPVPQSSQKKTSEDEALLDVADGKGADAAGKASLDNLGVPGKPADLPEKPYDIPPPKPPAAGTSNPLAIETPSKDRGSSGLTTGSKLDPTDGAASGTFHSLFFSFTMIIFSEIGDKTFLVAALMAMRHPRLVVFSAAFCALAAMTVLSAVLGHAVPTLIPKSFTKLLAAILFLVFGLKMLKEGRDMSPDEGVGEEMKEVEMELEEKEQQQLRMNRRRSSVTPHMLESGRAGRTRSRSTKNRLPSPPDSISSSSSRETSPGPRQSFNNAVVGIQNLFSLLLSPAWVQTFVMTFLGEWGDRSQIATIAMAAGQDYWWVTIGAITGHGICTAGAVIGGRAVAGKVSMRMVTLGGAVAFLVFGVIYLWEALL